MLVIFMTIHRIAMAAMTGPGRCAGAVLGSSTRVGLDTSPWFPASSSACTARLYSCPGTNRSLGQHLVEDVLETALNDTL